MEKYNGDLGCGISHEMLPLMVPGRVASSAEQAYFFVPVFHFVVEIASLAC